MTRSAIARKVFNEEERGLQIRFEDPFEPNDKQLWVNVFDRKLKYNYNNVVQEIFEGYAEGDQSSVLLNVPALNVDWSLGTVFQKRNTSGLTQLTFSNVEDGKSIVLFVLSNSLASTDLELPVGVKLTNDADYFLDAGFGVVIEFTNIGGTIFAKTLFKAEIAPFPGGSLGDLVILDGETVNIPAGDIYDYMSIDIQAGGTLNIDATLTPELTQIYCKNNFNLDGKITGKRIGNAGTFEKITGVGETVEFTIIQNLGGNGQAGNSTSGGSGLNGFGGGGGGASGVTFGGNGGSGGAPGAPGVSTGSSGGTAFGGPGGVGNFTLGDGLSNTSFTTSRGGQWGGRGGGSGGGGGAAGVFGRAPAVGAYGGAGGGYKGQHGVGLYLYLEGTVSGTGHIDLKGTNGFNGANAITVGQGLFGFGGAGGGGAGGSGGTLFVRQSGTNFTDQADTTLDPTKIFVDIQGGNGGNGGVRAYGPGGGAANGQNGSAGVYDVDDIL